MEDEREREKLSKWDSVIWVCAKREWDYGAFVWMLMIIIGVFECRRYYMLQSKQLDSEECEE